MIPLRKKESITSIIRIAVNEFLAEDAWFSSFLASTPSGNCLGIV